MMTIGYGIIKRKEWSLWLYCLITVIAFFTNPHFAVLAGIISVWLFDRKIYFTTGKINWEKIKTFFSRRTVEKIIVVDTNGDVLTEQTENISEETKK
jgi:hypothetical protein